MKKFFWIAIILTTIAGGIYLFNYISLSQPVLKELEIDSRNTGIKINLHYKYYILTHTLVFDLKNLIVAKAATDVFRILLQTSAILKENKFEIVELAFKGKSKFLLNGYYFKELGKAYGIETPLNAMRTFPQHLFDMEGRYPCIVHGPAVCMMFHTINWKTLMILMKNGF